jgi:hypothetical protein
MAFRGYNWIMRRILDRLFPQITVNGNVDLDMSEGPKIIYDLDQALYKVHVDSGITVKVL